MSRYLFRILVFIVWLLIFLLSVLYILVELHQRESEIRREFNANLDQAQNYIQRTADVIKELKYVTENRFDGSDGALPPLAPRAENLAKPRFMSISDATNCALDTLNWKGPIQSLMWFLYNWRDNLITSYDLNRVFLVGGESLCMADFSLSNIPIERQGTLKLLQEGLLKYRSVLQNERTNSAYWVGSGTRPGIGYFYTLTPVFFANRQQGLLGIEQTLRVENFYLPSTLPISVSILDDSGRTLISQNGVELRINPDSYWQQSRTWFGYSAGYKALVLKKSLHPSSLSVVYSVPIDVVLDKIRFLILNAVILNLLLAVGLILFIRFFERRSFTPAESDAQRLEEHDQFNRKIVASAPVGICILRTQDGTNILSNELAHNYLNMLSQEERQGLTKMICGQQMNYVDVLTSNHTKLQISFVHSRYRNENVAICVLVDVSARVKMEESLQEMAQSAEQASQSKSMFLATVSHELRTPLYGIIGNLDLLSTKSLPKGADRLVSAMSNSSSLLLKIISDILDFSKIESEQLRIEPREFSPREVMSYITGNFLPLVVRKQLGLYCFIDTNVPITLQGDPMRLQQVISNLLSNAIKFTDIGCIVLHIGRDNDYLTIKVRDTGVGIPAKEVMRLFDPFFQVETGTKQSFQGTGLGLAICEKLVNMMDGDISVASELGMGSQFVVRIPLYKVHYLEQPQIDAFADQRIWLNIRNDSLCDYLQTLLKNSGFNVQPWSTERVSSSEILITDDPITCTWEGKATIQFSITHIGSPIEHSPGAWIHSTVAPHEIVLLLARIYRVKLACLETEQDTTQLIETSEDNGDMMILVVDDHPINRRLLADQLALLGYKCLTADDGVDALNVLSKNHIDIVLSDVNMPNMDGYRLTQRIRQLGLTLPVIGVTANALAEEKQRCIAAGMDSCLSKPVTLEIVRKTLAIYANQVRTSRYQREDESPK